MNHYGDGPTSVSGGATATFVYDGDGRRVKADVGDVVTYYAGDYFEWTGATSTMKKYYYAGGVRVAMRTGSSDPLWLLGDHLGSTSKVASYDGLSVPSQQLYKPWGQTRYASGRLPTTYKFTGQREEVPFYDGSIVESLTDHHTLLMKTARLWCKDTHLTA